MKCPMDLKSTFLSCIFNALFRDNGPCSANLANKYGQIFVEQMTNNNYFFRILFLTVGKDGSTNWKSYETERVQFLLQQSDEEEEALKKEYTEKEEASKSENERALSLLLRENDRQEALMLARQEEEERSFKLKEKPH